MFKHSSNVQVSIQYPMSIQYYIEKKLHAVYPILYKPTLKNSKN